MTTHHNAAQAAQNAIEWATKPGTVENFPATARAHINGLASLLLSKLRPPAPAMQEAVLTDAEIREIQGTHLVTVRSRDALIASVIVAGRAIEAAVLSKLRAPVADERAPHIKALQDLRLGVEMDQHCMDDGDAKLAALDAAITALRWSAGALQALNVEADKITLDGETRTVGDILDHADRALASAPVAGEALDTLTITLEWDDGKSDEIEVHGTEKMLRRLQVWLDRKRGLFHDAAPLASTEDPKLPRGWKLALNLCIDAIKNAPPTGEEWPVNWPSILHGLVEIRDALDKSNSAHQASPVAGEAQPDNITSRRPSGVLSMDGASLHIHPDGSGKIIVAEGDFTLEDDRDEGPDGPQGSVHWVARLPASELIALRDFLTGHARPSDDALWDQTLTERDEYHDMADKLANAIADHLLVEIGEHSSSNCPWMRALEAIGDAVPQASAYGHTQQPMDTSPGHSAPQAPAGWRWTLHPAGLHPDVYAAAAAHTSDEARNAALEEAAAAIEARVGVGDPGIDTHELDRETQECANVIRALKSTPAPTAAEGGEDDMLTIAYLAGAQAEKERAGDGVDERAALAGLLDYVDRNTCTHEITHRGGTIWTICDGCGENWADDEGGFVPHQDAPAVAAARAALAARKEGDAHPSATQIEQGERDE